ncbi:MAG: 4-(cytidine 5'-diphospho)-2-C-methyl-D-erythritol kinase [Alloprevotella sp.]|nr:4-(cytidine 5'-diphospho)-2-C-methyl-D-erythritol kinase [Alloprevotella sp.]
MLLFPPAKLNIGLYVTRKRPDGYHDLETCFYPIPLNDTLELKPSREGDRPWELHLAGNRVEGEAKDNLVVRAFENLRADFPELPPTEIYLSKRIPTGAGLGGGSSDAASTLCGLNEMYALGLSGKELEVRAAKLGADCAFFVSGRAAFAEGIGDVLTPTALSLKGWELLLVKPDDFVSTAEAYRGVRPRPVLRGEKGREPLREALQKPVETWRDSIANDFEESVFRLHPRIAAIKATLYDMGAVFSSMSGSGSAVFGLFRRRPEEVQEVFKDCFVYQARLLR